MLSVGLVVYNSLPCAIAQGRHCRRCSVLRRQACAGLCVGLHLCVDLRQSADEAQWDDRVCFLTPGLGVVLVLGVCEVSSSGCTSNMSLELTIVHIGLWGQRQRASWHVLFLLAQYGECSAAVVGSRQLLGQCMDIG